MKYLNHIFLILVISISCNNKSEADIENSDVDYFSQGNYNRMAAEWEPASGIMITWPLSIPYKMAIELSKDSQLFVLVENEESENDALKWFTSWGIDSTKVKFIFAKQGIDAWWVRDWGPYAVFTANKKMKLGDAKYIYSTPLSELDCNDKLDFRMTAENKIMRTDTEDQATKEIAKTLNLDILNLPFISTGGNVMTDGMGTAFSTCVLTNENRFDGISDQKYFQLNKEILGIKKYNILSNFEEHGIQHIDCFMKLLDEERILVLEPPKDHASYAIYENIINNELSKLKTVYNHPYQILRIHSYCYRDQLLAAYTNSLILNKTVYVPLFGIEGDSMALKTWTEVMPGYTIKGFRFELKDEPVLTDKMKTNYNYIGWDEGDALHCRTRALWDADMLYISAKRINSTVSKEKQNRVFASIIDYSKKGIITGSSNLYWRIKGDINWNKVTLTQTQDDTHFYGNIPQQKESKTIEYYISASSKSGRTETMPRTAPEGFYTFSIQ